jgi:hypothetical protein
VLQVARCEAPGMNPPVLIITVTLCPVIWLLTQHSAVRERGEHASFNIITYL